LSLILIGSSTLYGQATSESWNVGTGSWLTGTNWNPTGPPTNTVNAFVENGGTAQVDGPGAMASTLDIGGLEGGTGTVQLQSGGFLTVSNGVTIGAGGTLLYTGGNNLITANVNMQNNGSIVFDSSTDSSWSFNFFGSGKLTLNGTGTVTLTGTSTYSGGTTINAGTLQIGNGGTTGSITGDVVDNGTLSFNRSDNFISFNGGITGTGGLVKLQGGTLTLGGTNTYFGTTMVDAGTLQAGSKNVFSPNSAFVVNATLDLNANDNTIGSLSGSGTVTGGGFENPPTATLAVGNDNTNTTFAGTLQDGSGFLALNKIGTGTLILTGTNSYSGFTPFSTTISSGTLQLGNGGTTGSITGSVLDNGIFAFDHSNRFVFGGTINGSGSVQQNGTGTLVLTAINSYGGGTNLNSGIIAVNSDVNLGSGPLIFNGGTLEASAFVSSKTITLTGGGTFLADSGTSTLSGPISGPGAWTKAGSGTLVLSGTNTYFGSTTVAAGILQAGSPSGFSANSAFTVNTGATLDLNGFNNSVGSLSGSGLVTNTGGPNLLPTTLTAGGNNASTIFSGTLTDGVVKTSTLALTKVGTGTLTLTGTNQYSGNTNVAQGTLIVNGSVGGGSVNVASGATLGGTGTIGVPVTIQNGGILSPGASPGTLIPGTLTMGTLTLNSGSVLNYQLGIPNMVGNGANDLVNVNGNLTLAGTLNVTNVGGFAQGVYRLFNYTGSLTNSGLKFGTLPLPASDFLLQTSQANQINLIVSSSGFTDQFWDGATTTADGIIHGGSGTWNNVTTNWTNIDATANAPWNKGFAIFEGTAGTVNLGDNINFSGMQFMTDGYIIAAPANQTLIAATGTIIRVGQGVTATISAPIVDGSRAADVTKTDLGTLILTGTNTYTGGTTISTGTLQLGNGGTSGSIVGNVTDNGVFAIDRSDIYTFAGMISGSGSFEQRGTGTTIFTGNNTYQGGTTISAGTLQLGNGGTTGSITGSVIDNSILAFNRSDVVTFGGAISGTGSVQQIGPGTTVLTANNTYTGGTVISAGTLQLGNGGTTGSIIGDVVDNGVLAFNRSDVVTFAGAISGTGSVQQNGTGTTVLIANNTYAGRTTINAGTLELGNGGTTGSIIGDVVDNGILAFNRSDSVTFGGAISGTGSVQQIGTGTTILTGESTYTGQTTIDSGSLIDNGSIASTQTVVNPGGFLGGTGLIEGNLVNNGTVSPGNPVGTLTIGGNYTQTATGLLHIAVTGLSPGQFGQLVVNGHAGIAGTLDVISLSNFKFQVGEKLTLLSANGGVSGTFSSIKNPFISNTIVKAEVVITPATVEITGTQGSFATTPGVAKTPNESAVAKALDSAAGDPRAAALFAFLNSQPLANLPHDLSLIAPTQISSMNATTVSLGKIQASNIGQRLLNIRAGSTGFSSSGFGITGGMAFDEGFAGPNGSEGKAAPPAFVPTPENRWGVFVTGTGEFTNVDSTSNAAGYDVDTGGITVGVDYRLTPNFVIGLDGSYAHSNIGLNGGGSVDVNAGSVGLYATVFANNFYLDAAVSGGPNGYDTLRTALQGSASGNTDGANANVLVAGGYDWKRGDFSIGPTAAFQFSYVSINGFTETGSLAPLKFRDQSYESERTIFGAKASYNWKIGKVALIPQVSAGWVHEYGSVAYAVVANFANGAGNSFTVDGPEIGRDGVLVDAGMSMLWSDRVSTYIYYDGELARTNYDSHTVTGGIRISF